MSATRKSRRQRSQPQDLLDPSGIVNAEAERGCLAALLDLVDRDPATATAVAATLTGDAFTIDYGPEILVAIRDAASKPKPSIRDVQAALRAELVRQNVDPAAGTPALTAIAEDETATGYGADRRAADGAAIVQEFHARRRAVRAMAEALRRVHDERPMPEELEALSAAIREVAALAAGRQGGGRRLRVRTAADITPLPIEWLWPSRISRGCLTIITGMPGLSKSLLTLDIAARITTGGKWPDGTGSAPRGGVLLFGMEDDPERVVVPRLLAAGADLDLVRIVDGAEEGRQEWLTPISVDRDLQLVRQELDAFPDCRAMIFDPLPQFVDVEENSNGQTRAALAPLVHLAQERDVAIIAVCHLNKKSDSAMIQRIAGASAYGQMARHIIFVGHDPDDTTTGKGRRRAMIVAKSSYGGEDTGQLYRVTSRSGDHPGLEWIAGTVERDAESLNPKPPGVNSEYQEKRGEAVDALRDALARGPRPGREVEAELEEQGFRRRQVDYARKVLQVRKYQCYGQDGRRVWEWALPEGMDDLAEIAAEVAADIGMTSLDQWRPPK